MGKSSRGKNRDSGHDIEMDDEDGQHYSGRDEDYEGNPHDWVVDEQEYDVNVDYDEEGDDKVADETTETTTDDLDQLELADRLKIVMKQKAELENRLEEEQRKRKRDDDALFERVLALESRLAGAGPSKPSDYNYSLKFDSKEHPKFDGTSHPDPKKTIHFLDWYNSIERYLRLDYNIADEVKGMKMSKLLTGEAANHFTRAVGKRVTLTLDEFKDIMLKAPLSKPESQYVKLQRLLSIQQGGDSLIEYTHHFDLAVTQVHQLADNTDQPLVQFLLVCLYNNGLRRGLRSINNPATNQMWATYDESREAVFNRHATMADLDVQGRNGSSGSNGASGSRQQAKTNNGQQQTRPPISPALQRRMTQLPARPLQQQQHQSRFQQKQQQQQQRPRLGTERPFRSAQEVAWLKANARCFRCCRTKDQHDDAPFGSNCTLPIAYQMPAEYARR